MAVLHAMHPVFHSPHADMLLEYHIYSFCLTQLGCWLGLELGLAWAQRHACSMHVDLQQGMRQDEGEGNQEDWTTHRTPHSEQLGGWCVEPPGHRPEQHPCPALLFFCSLAAVPRDPPDPPSLPCSALPPTVGPARPTPCRPRHRRCSRHRVVSPRLQGCRPEQCPARSRHS